MTEPAEQQRLADAHWAEVCRLSQAMHRRLGARQWIGTLLVRAGLRLLEPLTVQWLLETGEA